MTLVIPATDHGKIRVFAVDAPAGGLADRSPEALVATFGNAPLNADFVDIIDIAALDDLSLIDYMQEGYDVEPDAADTAALENLTGTVVLIMSRAHEGGELTLVLASGVRHVTTLGRGARMTVAARLEIEATTGVIGAPDATKKPKSDARIGGMVATIALVLMFALVGIMVWVGG